ncbi:uncharacterized protein LOC62_06G008363 [Vanrija pseudolonga]|uniref:Inhibitor I9 domain-containing protein n=1 Tax=Vanrija pseudolonga TaxID=143232 RepID=A0AAF0YED7_9TREE|nr:hypothetical protein LOC62_06G008363 [Vanrija pseudolonga]
MSLPLLSRIAPLLFRRQLSTTTASIMADKQVRLRLIFVLAAAFGVLYLAHVRGYTSTALSYAGVAGSSGGGDFATTNTHAHGHGLTAAHADHVQVIVTFKKGASSADKAAILNGVVAKGGKVVDKSDADSSIFPYAVVSISPDSFAALQSASLDDKHDVIKGVEEDKEVRIQ